MLRFFTVISLPILLAFSFSAMPANGVFACGKDKGCCEKEAEKESGDCCQAKGGRDEKDCCGGHCGKEGCPCPAPAQQHHTALPTPAAPATEPPLATEAHSKADWYFLNKIPAAVHLSVWLPPKI